MPIGSGRQAIDWFATLTSVIWATLMAAGFYGAGWKPVWETLPGWRVTFQDYPDIAGTDAFISDYRAALDRAVRLIPLQAAIGEAALAFEMNTALSNAVKAYADNT